MANHGQAHNNLNGQGTRLVSRTERPYRCVMPRARKNLVCVNDTPYYHVVSRCVRRAFLCGTDTFSGKSYDHRRSWIEGLVRVLSSIFSIELCAYAIMSNHYHLVVKLNPAETDAWSNDEVLERWTALFRGPLLVQRYQAGDALSATETDTVRAIAAVYRQRLRSLSWFMKCLNEPIARQANKEDGCTGHFWEARFQSQALKTETALIAAMAYVDLNPVRAKIATTPETSQYTSIKARLDDRHQTATLTEAIAGMIDKGELNHFNMALRPLLRFSARTNETSTTIDTANALPVNWAEYLKLVDAAGRCLSKGKRGRVDPSLPPILERLGLGSREWLDVSTAFRCHYRNGDLRQKRTS